MIRYVLPVVQVDAHCPIPMLKCNIVIPILLSDNNKSYEKVDVHAQMWDRDDQFDFLDHPLLRWILASS